MRTVGSPIWRHLVTIYLPSSAVMPLDGKRYVFIEVLAPLIRAVSKQTDTAGIYSRFTNSLRQGLYNSRRYYDVSILDIDNPHRVAVSVELKLKIGKGINSCQWLN